MSGGACFLPLTVLIVEFYTELEVVWFEFASCYWLYI